LSAASSGRLNSDEQRRIVRRAELEAAEMLDAPEGVGFRAHQLITHVFLDERILPLVIALIFLLVFGLRVNERIGNVWMLILYPLLAASTAEIDLVTHRHDALAPTLGPSAAVSALAGMYAVLFALQRVYLTAWTRFGSFLKFKLLTVRAFWVVILWSVINNLLPAFFSDEPVSHWSHLGGFALGALAAMALLLMRQVNIEGGDLLSRALRRRPSAPRRKAGDPARTVPA
jgi:membrane associated rhomboid family serine protease